MPVTVKPEGDKFRVVDAETGKPEANAAGTAVDGGGHDTEKEAIAQARATNARKGVRTELIEALSLGLPGFLTSSTPEEVAGLGVTIRTGKPEGPFGGIAQVPVGVLEILPTPSLARLRNERNLFWVPLELEQSQAESSRLAELLTGETNDHTHAYSEGDKNTGPPIPEDPEDQHTHGLSPDSKETEPAPAKPGEDPHTHSLPIADEPSPDA